MSAAIILAGLVVLTIVAIVVIARHRDDAASPRPDGFFTRYAQEEPTRTDVAYTGTIPYGTWGNEPWAEMFPHARSDSGCCSRTRLRDVSVGTDVAPICRTCGETRPVKGGDSGYFVAGAHAVPF